MRKKLWFIYDSLDSKVSVAEAVENTEQKVE